MTCTNMTFEFSFWRLQRGKKGKNKTMFVNKDSSSVKSAFLDAVTKTSALVYHQTEILQDSSFGSKIPTSCFVVNAERTIIPLVTGLSSSGISPFGCSF